MARRRLCIGTTPAWKPNVIPTASSRRRPACQRALITLDPQGMYVDPECKQRLVHRGADIIEAETSFAAVWLGEFWCDVQLQVFRAGVPGSPSGSRYARLGSGGCQKVAEPETHLGATPMLGSGKSPATSRPSQSKGDHEAGAGAAHVVESEGGARALWGWWNAARGEPCAYEQALGNDSLRLHGGSDGTLRCRPMSGSVSPEEAPRGVHEHGFCLDHGCPASSPAQPVLPGGRAGGRPGRPALLPGGRGRLDLPNLAPGVAAIGRDGPIRRCRPVRSALARDTGRPRSARALGCASWGNPCRPATTNDGRVVCAPYEAAGVRRFLSAHERCR